MYYHRHFGIGLKAHHSLFRAHLCILFQPESARLPVKSFAKLITAATRAIKRSPWAAPAPIMQIRPQFSLTKPAPSRDRVSPSLFIYLAGLPRSPFFCVLVFFFSFGVFLFDFFFCFPPPSLPLPPSFPPVPRGLSLPGGRGRPRTILPGWQQSD